MRQNEKDLFLELAQPHSPCGSNWQELLIVRTRDDWIETCTFLLDDGKTLYVHGSMLELFGKKYFCNTTTLRGLKRSSQ